MYRPFSQGMCLYAERGARKLCVGSVRIASVSSRGEYPVNESRRSAVVAALAWRLRSRGSWSGETHIQKATYLLQYLAGVPLDYEFILYKHGPFSFELRTSISTMRGDGVIQLQVQPYPYGPSLVVADEQKRRIEALYPRALAKYGKKLDSLAKWVGEFDVSRLEQVATALYVTRENTGERRGGERARRIQVLKPHVTFGDAEWAIAQIDEYGDILGGGSDGVAWDARRRAME